MKRSSQQKILGVIPARLNSTRLPQKMLADIGGLPLICRTYLQAKKSRYFDRLIVATDSQRIVRAVAGCGGQTVITSKKHRSGTARAAEAVQLFKDFKPEIIINIQGDEPLVPIQAISAVAKAVLEDSAVDMATAAAPFRNNQKFYSLVKRKIASPDSVKMIVDKNNFAIYFSRSVIPYPRHKYDNYFRHIGIYGFRKKFLLKYINLKPMPLEQAESLEQLRVLEHGYKIKVVIGDFDNLEVNTSVDLKLLRKIVKQQKYEK